MDRLARLCLLLSILILGCSGVSTQPTRVIGPTHLVPSADDYRTEKLLRTTPKPPRDFYDLYARLKGRDARETRISPGSTAGWTTGSKEKFWVGDLNKNEYSERAATLQHVSPSAYWFVEDGGSFSLDGLRASATRYEEVVRRNRSTFGTEWLPGVDGDPRMVILVASTPGAGGYYSTADEYSDAVNPYSNEHEMIYVNLDSVPGSPFFDAVLAHEHHHMIHWRQHASQDVWINEGMAEYAVELNGYSEGLNDAQFAAQPDTQLNAWSDAPGETAAHYGQAYRLMSYLAGRFGPGFLADIIQSEGTGLDALDDALQDHPGDHDLSTVYADWLVANYMAKGEKDRFHYPRGVARVASKSLAVSDTAQTTVNQWGADYYTLDGGDSRSLTFAAQPSVPLVDSPARDGKYQWYSNRGDLLDSTLTREVDLTGLQEATLEIEMWYEIEEHFDYAYVEMSSDRGETWQALPGDRTTNDNPNGNNLGNGITGKSDGWITQSFDISSYAGSKALLRIEYVTDDGYNTQGLVVDGVRIPQAGFSDDSESKNAWQSKGWVRSNNRLPARYRLLLLDPNGAGSYSEVPVGVDGKAVFRAPASTGEPLILIVSGVAEATTSDSTYRIESARETPGLLATVGARLAPHR